MNEVKPLQEVMTKEEMSKMISEYTEVIESLRIENEQYKEALNYIDKAIYTQHATMNHMENTDYEKGQISGLITASNIVKNAQERIR